MKNDVGVCVYSFIDFDIFDVACTAYKANDLLSMIRKEKEKEAHWSPPHTFQLMEVSSHEKVRTDSHLVVMK